MLIVSGMHRSGTSLVARLLAAFDADMGDPSGFYSADKWNPDGYYEQEDIQAINMRLLHGPFWKFSYFALPGEKQILARGKRHSGEIASLGAKYRDCLAKECRFCLTLPAWRAQGVEIDGALMCLREPISVARSLKRRNKIPIWYGLRLWFIHNSRLLSAAKDIPLTYVNYADLVDSERFEGTATRIAQFANKIPSKQVLDDFKSSINWQPATMAAASNKPAYNYTPEVNDLWASLLERSH